MRRVRKYWYALPICASVLLTNNATAQEPVRVRTDYSSEYLTSQFQLGLTHATNAINEWGDDPASISRMMHYLEFGPVKLQNTHIMGWGAGNPNPEPGVYNWSSLDYRIARMKENDNAEVVITFCTAPGWMKTTGEDWAMNDRVADEHFEDFAELCRMVAARYQDVRYFQVWNEFKGFYGENEPKYIQLYNTVYNAVRAERPDALIGGFYKGFPDDLVNGGDLSTHSHELIDDWLEHNVGADFICFDGWIQGWPNQALPEERLMELTPCFGVLSAQISEKTDLPVWISEYYGAHSVGSAQFQAANHASCYYHSLINGTSVGLHWDPFSYSPLFTNPSTSTGAQPTVHYNVFRYFNRYFGPGRQLYKTVNSDSLKLEVLSTATKTLLINKRPSPVTVDLDGKLITLDPYEVELRERSETLSMVTGDIESIAGLIFPLDPKDPTVQWSSADKDVASINENGTIAAQASGKTEIKVTYQEAGFTDSLTIEVYVRNVLPVMVQVDISKVAIPPWFQTMYLADKQISNWNFVAMKQDPVNAFIYYYSDTLEDGCEIRPTFAFANNWGTAEKPPTCVDQGLSSRTQVVSTDNHDFTFSWDEYDCTDLLDPVIQNPEPTANILFSLDMQMGSVAREILGQQLVYNYEADSLWSGPDAYLYSEIENLSTGILRYPGGIVTNYFHWNNPTGTYVNDNWDPSYQHDSDVDPEYWMSVDEYFKICDGLGLTPLLGVNIESGLVYGREQDGIDEAAALAEYAITKGFEGSYYYLGNEPYVQDKNGVKLSAAEYANRILNYGPAIRAADPEARLIIGWDRFIAEKTEALQEIMRIAGEYIDIVDVHWYWNPSRNSVEVWRNQQGMTASAQRYTGGTFEEDAIAFKDLVAEWGYPDVKLASLEYNAGAGNTYTGPAEFEISLMVGEMLMQYMNGGVDLACLWPTHFPFMYYADHENACTLFDHSRALDKNAMYDIFYFMKDVQGKRLLGSDSGNDWVYSVVLQDALSAEIDVYLLNRSDTVISGKLPLASQFKEPAHIALSKVTHYVDGHDHRADTIEGSFTNADGQTSVDLPPFSITKIHLPGKEELFTKMFNNLNIIVLDQGNGEPLAGCQVKFGDHASLTSLQGVAILDSIDYGIITLSLSAAGYTPAEYKRIEIISDTTLIFKLKEFTSSSTITVKLCDRATRDPVNRAQFRYKGQLKITNSSGEITLQDARTGPLAFTCEHNDYFILSDSIVITSDTLYVIPLTRKAANIHFEVQGTKGPISRVAIQVNDFKVYTDASGLVWISGQPARKEYSYSIEEAGYEAVRDNFFLEMDTTISLQLETLTGYTSHPLDYLKIYPNPAADMINILSPVDVSLQIEGIGGQVLMQKNVQVNSGEINISGLPAGFYILKIYYGSVYKFTRIMIIR